MDARELPEFDDFRDQYVALNGEPPDPRTAFAEGRRTGYVEAVRNHDTTMVHGYCVGCACRKADWEQEDWAHVG